MRPRVSARQMLRPRRVPREKLAAALRCLILMTVFAMARLQPEGRSEGFDYVALAGAAYVLVTTFIPWWRLDARRTTLVMLAADTLLITALIYTESGIRSDYYLLYYLPILHASVRLNLRDAAGACIFAATSYLLVGILERPDASVTVPVASRVGTFAASAGLLAAFFVMLSRERRAFDRVTRQYEEATKAKSEFLSRLSHEFRTPLTAIVGFTQLLHEHKESLDPERQVEYLTVVREQSQQLARMIEDMLDVTRIDDGRLELHPDAQRLQEVVESALMLLDSPAERERVAVTIEPGTPPVYVDRAEMEQALSRVMYYTLAGVEEGQKIALQAAPSDKYKEHIEVTVRARGLDAESEDMVAVFGPSAAMLSERPSSGRALGLAVAKALVELHGGRVWLDDSDGETAICLILPKHRVEVSGPAVIVGSMEAGDEGAETDGTGEIDDSGRRPVGTEAGAG